MYNYSYKFNGTLAFNHHIVDFKDADKNADLIDNGVTGIELVQGPGIDLDKVGLNLDHHGPSHDSKSPAACDLARLIPLEQVKKDLLYSRLDVDSLTAGAILELRAAGTDLQDIDGDIVNAVSYIDRCGPHNAPEEVKGYQAVTVFLARLAMDRNLSVEDKIRIAMGMILIGDSDSALDKESDAAQAWAEREAEFEQAHKDLNVQVYPSGLVVVDGNSRFASNLIYEFGDVGIAFNDKFPVDFRDPSKGTCYKATIMKRDANVPFDMNQVAERLNLIEKEHGSTGKWGGRGEIIGSPMGMNYTVPKDDIIAIVNEMMPTR